MRKILLFVAAVLPVALAGVSAARDASPPRVSLDVDGATLDVELLAGAESLPRADLLAWIRSSAHAVGHWYGAFPVHEVRVVVRAMPGDHVGGATTWPGSPPRIEIPVGSAITGSGYGSDWTLVHEMTHLAFPSVAPQHHWIEEGLATYLEPWERVGVGGLAPEVAWHDFARDLPQGLPGPGDRGLDHTHTWGRTYWGGALYCFVADVEIRRQTGNRKGLRDAVAGMVSFGGMAGGSVRDLGDVLAAGDAAVGVPVLTDTWRRMADDAYSPDLAGMFRDLGVEMTGDTVIFHADAPLAAVREAIAPLP